MVTWVWIPSVISYLNTLVIPLWSLKKYNSDWFLNIGFVSRVFVLVILKYWWVVVSISNKNKLKWSFKYLILVSEIFNASEGRLELKTMAAVPGMKVGSMSSKISEVIRRTEFLNTLTRKRSLFPSVSPLIMANLPFWFKEKLLTWLNLVRGFSLRRPVSRW